MFDKKDIFGILGVILVIGLVALFTGEKQDESISGHFSVSSSKFYGGSFSGGLVAPASKVYGGGIQRLHPSQFSSGKAVYFDKEFGSICPPSYQRIRIEEALQAENAGYHVFLPGGTVGMNRFACKIKLPD